MDSWEEFRKEKNGKSILGNVWYQGHLTIKHKEWDIILDSYTKGIGHRHRGRVQTRIRVPVSLNKDLNFVIFRDNLFNKLGKLFKMQDIQISDVAFDKEFIIQGNDPQKIKALLTDSTIKKMLHEKLVGYIGMNNHKGWLFKEQLPIGVSVLHFEVNAIICDKETLEGITLLMSNILDRLVAITSIKAGPPNFKPRKTFRKRTVYFIMIGVALLLYSLKTVITDEETIIEEPITEEITPIKNELEETIIEQDLKTEKSTISNNENQPFNIKSILPIGTSTVFNNSKLYSSSKLLTSTSSCKEGDSIIILDIGSLYIADEHGQVQLTSNFYNVMYNDTEAVLKGSNLAMKQLVIGETKFIIGTNNNDGKLVLKVFQNGTLLDKTVLMDKAYKINVYETDYDLFRFQFNRIYNEDFKGLYFFQFTDENNGSDGWLQNRTYYWNGTTFKQVVTNEKINNLIEFELIFPTDKNGIQDTLTYKALTGYMDESGDLTEKETHLFHFTINNGILKQVSEK